MIERTQKAETAEKQRRASCHAVRQLRSLTHKLISLFTSFALLSTTRSSVFHALPMLIFVTQMLMRMPQGQISLRNFVSAS